MRSTKCELVVCTGGMAAGSGGGLVRLVACQWNRKMQLQRELEKRGLLRSFEASPVKEKYKK